MLIKIICLVLKLFVIVMVNLNHIQSVLNCVYYLFVLSLFSCNYMYFRDSELDLTCQLSNF